MKSDPVKICKTSLEVKISNIMKYVHSTLTVVTYKVTSMNKQLYTNYITVKERNKQQCSQIPF